METDALFLRTVRFLSIRPRSEKEVRDYLKKIIGKDADLEKYQLIMQSIIQKLREKKFLNDYDFAKWFLRSRSTYKIKGEQTVRFELRQKGIAEEVIDSAFQEAKGFAGEERRDEVALATVLLTKKMRQYEGLGARERFQKAGAMLARKGFSFEVARKAIDSVFGKMV